jgi:hypothetical protein
MDCHNFFPYNTGINVGNEKRRNMSDKGNNDLLRFAALQLSIIYSTVPINLGKVGTVLIRVEVYYSLVPLTLIQVGGIFRFVVLESMAGRQRAH